MCPLNELVSEAELNKIWPQYLQEVLEIATPWVTEKGVANPYTMLWVAATKSS